MQRREPSIAHQIRFVECFKDMILVATIEGRVAVEFCDNAPELAMKRYSFKCHRSDTAIHPVNALAFNPKASGVFVSGGSDGTVCAWDPSRRKRVWKSELFPTNISSLAFSADGLHLAVASSYMYQTGWEPDIPRDEIYIINTEEILSGSGKSEPQPRKL
jgi:cell cycle arrest protein BUB3